MPRPKSRSSAVPHDFKIIKNAQGKDIWFSPKVWDQVSETLAIATHPQLMKQITEGEKDIQCGRVHALDAVFRQLLEEK